MAVKPTLRYSNFKSLSNRSTKIFLFEQLLFSKVGFTVVKAEVVEAAKLALLN